MRRVGCVLGLLALVCVAACSSDSSTPAAPSLNVPFSTTDLVVGTGAVAANGTSANVNYTGWVYSATAANNKGSQFQSGNFSFVVGGSGVIAGFNQGVVGMRVGGSRRIVMPPELAYANNPPSGSGIPANATLIFEVGLVSVQ